MAGAGYPIFLDTQVFEAVSFNFETTALVSLLEQVDKGNIRLILTDVTVLEVKARIEKTVLAQLELLKKFKREARVLRSSRLPEVKAALDLDEKNVIGDLQQQFDEFIGRAKAEIVDTSALPAGPVFLKYFANEPPFGSGDKKSEFPDAFVVEALLGWTKKNAEPLFAISGDKPFRASCQPHKTLLEFETLSELLDQILFDDAVATFIRDQVIERLEDIKNAAKQEFEDRIYYVDDEDGDAEMSVQSLELEGQPEIIEADENSATIEVRFKGKFDASLSYDDSSTGMYDSETRSMMFMEHKHEILEKEEEFVVEVKVKFEVFDPDKFEIEKASLERPDFGYSVSTSRWDGYPWK